MGNERWRQKKLCQYSCYQVGCGYDGDVCVTCCARGEAQPSAGFSPLGFHMPLLIPSEGKQAAPLQGLCAILSLVFFWLHCYTCSVISRGFTFFFFFFVFFFFLFFYLGVFHVFLFEQRFAVKPR